MSLIDGAFSHARTVLSIFALLLIAGAVAYVNIPKEASPDVNIPLIYVNLHHEGISPEDAERLLIRPVETEVQSIEGVKEMRSIGYEGGANVLLEFEAGFDANKALQDVREKVDLARPELPEETDEPTVHEVNFSLFPVLVVTLGGDVPERTLLSIARDLRDRIEGLPSVLDVEIGGEREELVEIVIDPVKLESYGLDAQDIIDFANRSNRLVAAGALDTGVGRFAIKVQGLFENVTDILTLPLKVEGDSVVLVRDVATVRPHFKDRETFARVNGKPALALEVVKRSGENVIDTIEAVRTLIENRAGTFPQGLVIRYTQDQSVFIDRMLTDLQNNVLSAILLVMIVVVGALGLRTGLLVGIAIPGSFLTGILVLAISGITVNVVVLFSLILAVGMLVDGAIVVTEYADRKMTEGESKASAYALAAKRMAWPIIASTATTLAAFVPLLFWPGVVGEFMSFLPITLIATLTASLAMALVFVPTIGAMVGRPGAADPATMRALAGAESGNFADIRGPAALYVRGLDRALDHPWKILIASLVVLIGAWGLYATFGKGVEFFPQGEPDQAALQIHARGNLSVTEKDALVAQVEQHVLQLQEERGEFQSIYTLSGNTPVRDEDAEDIIGTVNLEFVDWRERRPAAEIIADILERTSSLAGIQVESREQEMGPPVGKPIHIEIAGHDASDLEQATGTIRRHLDGVEGLRDLEDSRPVPGIEWELAVDRAQAAKFGVDVTLVGQMVRLVTNGLQLSTYRPDRSDDEIDIVARFPTEMRTLDQLDELRIRTPAGQVPISNFVERRPEQKTGVIRRVDGSRIMFVRSDVADGVLADDKVREIQSWLQTAELPESVSVRFKGEDEEQRQSFAFLTKAFGVALFIMAIILVTQFNSFYSAFLILSAVVMSTVGVMLGLLVISQPFGIVMSGIGVIALAGIVVNNNIVLIDTFDRLRETVGDSKDAVLRTGAQRFRPVMLTTITTILGLMPMTLRTNIDFITREVTVGAPSTDMWVQLSTAIVFGLGFATLLTLVVTPCALMVRINLRNRRRGAPAAETEDASGERADKLAAE